MAEYESLSAAMDAKDDLGEAERRYRLLSEAFEAMPQLRANLNPALDRVKAEILGLRAMAGAQGEEDSSADAGKVVAFDPTRFQKTTG